MLQASNKLKSVTVFIYNIKSLYQIYKLPKNYFIILPFNARVILLMASFRDKTVTTKSNFWVPPLAIKLSACGSDSNKLPVRQVVEVITISYCRPIISNMFRYYFFQILQPNHVL